MKTNLSLKHITVILFGALLVATLSACSLLHSASDVFTSALSDSTASAFTTSETEPIPTKALTTQALPSAAVTTASSPTTVATNEPAPTSVVTTAPAPVTTDAPESEVRPDPQEKRLSFLAAGDNLIHHQIYEYAEDSSEQDGYNFLPIYSRVADIIADADLAFLNQETMMDDSIFYSGYPCFNTPEAMANDLAALGFDIATIGNNHTYDRGTAAVLSTIKKLNSVGIVTFGAYKDAEDEANIRVITQNGIRIAFLNYTYGTNVRHDGKTSVCVPFIEDGKMISDLEKANAISDFVIVSVHWGTENTYEHNSEQKRVAKLLAENGAGIIIGTHPHTLQPIEWIDDGKGGKVLCAYSIGNFISNMSRECNMMGGLLTFDIVMNEGDEKAYIEDPLLTPTAFYYSSAYDDMYLMYLQDFNDEHEPDHGVLINCGKVVDDKSLVNHYIETIANEFRIELYRDE